MIDFEHAAAILQPQVCYSIAELNALLPELSSAQLIEAHNLGLIPRSLGEGIQLHFLGADVLDFVADGQGDQPTTRRHTRHASRVDRKNGRLLADD